MPTNDLVDLNEVLKNLLGEKKKLEAELTRSKGILSNANFLAKAPEAKVQNEKDKLASYEKQYDEVCKHIEDVNKQIK
ncbi:MAG: hypothetical protein L6U99_12640 [Clostridium sp.]|nr:MAG: hypothetical protein L6U99_12640 [Clostridium sp.]